MNSPTIRCIVTTLLLCVAASAQAAPAGPGHYPIEELRLFTASEPQVDIDLTGAMIQVAVGATAEQNPELSELLAGIERVRVRVGSLPEGDAASYQNDVEQLIGDLEGSGWHRMIRVNESPEQVLVYSMELDGMIEGLTALVFDGSQEVVMVNIVGRMDPVLIGRLMANTDGFSDLDFDALIETD
jgi:hypothetical protein